MLSTPVSSRTLLATAVGGLVGYLTAWWLDRRRQQAREDAQLETDLYRVRGGRAR